MGAISSASSVPILRQYLSDPERTVRETCEIAIAKIEWDNSEEGRKHSNELQDSEIQWAFISLDIISERSDANERNYTSIDPAPPTSGLLSGKNKSNDISESNISTLRSTLLDTRLPLFERYRAMFALRNIGTPTAVDALAAGFSDDSALFK